MKAEADSNGITEPRPYVCTVCDKWFKKRKYLNIHRKRRHSGVDTKHKCSECGKCFLRSCDLAVHGRTHSGERPFECTVCSRRFATSSNLYVHGRIHSGEKPYTCSVCGSSFSRSWVLQQHRRRVHNSAQPYRCPYCAKLFKTSECLNQHVHGHTDASLYSCRHCSHRFSTHAQLRRHLIESQHDQSDWFTCYVSEKKFASQRHLKEHVRQHRTTRPHVRSECTKRSARSSNSAVRGVQMKTNVEAKLTTPPLQSHSEPTWFTCDICRKNFSCTGDRKAHMLLQHCQSHRP